MHDVIVIGGGIVGASAAYHLAKSGAKTLLIDRRDKGRATDAGAGILSAETSGASLPASWFPFALQAVGYYSPLIGELESEGVGDTGYAVTGELIVAVDDDELDAYAEKKRVIDERQHGRGLPSVEDLHEVSPAEARELFPALGQVQKALYFSGAARVDGRLLAAALLKMAERSGLANRAEGVDSLIVEGSRVTGVQVGSETISADQVIIAGGAWSVAFGTQLGVQIPVEPQRGQIIHLSLPETDTGKWPIVDAFHGHYMVAWADSRVVVGATREVGSGFVPYTSAAGVHEVLGEAMRVAPGLSSAQVADIRVGLRPRTADNLPVMGGIPGVEGLYLAMGHGANGLQLGPFSGKLAAEWALGVENGVDISAFSITRFGG
ncbi:MAG: FAD-binding oxidoreductase [Anaerolineae bacterium]|nr:FAD-binding oxidoreductase [Anaerolineae bacterium]